jgi:hypothetical protein
MFRRAITLLVSWLILPSYLPKKLPACLHEFTSDLSHLNYIVIYTWPWKRRYTLYIEFIERTQNIITVSTVEWDELVSKSTEGRNYYIHEGLVPNRYPYRLNLFGAKNLFLILLQKMKETTLRRTQIIRTPDRLEQLQIP